MSSSGMFIGQLDRHLATDSKMGGPPREQFSSGNKTPKVLAPFHLVTASHDRGRRLVRAYMNCGRRARRFRKGQMPAEFFFPVRYRLSDLGKRPIISCTMNWPNGLGFLLPSDCSSAFLIFPSPPLPPYE